MTADQNDNGFSLVEMLVTLALLSLMAVYALQSMQTMRALNGLSERIERQTEVDAVERRLSSELVTARPEMRNLGMPSQELIFDGTKMTLRYVTISSGDREIGGLYLVNLEVNEMHQLEMQRQLLGQDGAPPVETLQLLQGISSISFSYGSNTDSSQAATEKQADWQNRDHLPELIQLEVNFRANNLRKWKPMTVWPIFAE